MAPELIPNKQLTRLQTRIFLIIGRNDVPMRVMGAGRFQALLISVHVILPVFALVNVRGAEFPVMIRFINALKESLSLFILRKVAKEFNDPRSVAIEVAFQIYNGSIPLLPDGFLVAQLFGKPLAARNLRMKPYSLEARSSAIFVARKQVA